MQQITVILKMGMTAVFVGALTQHRSRLIPVSFPAFEKVTWILIYWFTGNRIYDGRTTP